MAIYAVALMFPNYSALLNFIPGLIGHLERHFPAHHRLFELLLKRDSPPTDDERAYANATRTLSSDVAKQYLEKLDAVNQNIKQMFERQAAASEVSAFFLWETHSNAL